MGPVEVQKTRGMTMPEDVKNYNEPAQLKLHLSQMNWLIGNTSFIAQWKEEHGLNNQSELNFIENLKTLKKKTWGLDHDG